MAYCCHSISPEAEAGVVRLLFLFTKRNKRIVEIKEKNNNNF
jgi:hypothetical protein